MKKLLPLLSFGLLSWLIPFVSSIIFYTKDGVLTIDIFLFKSIMIVIGSISASILLVTYFKKVSENFVKEGWVVGVAWFIINILLDLIVLLPMSKMTLSDYFSQIGLRYVVIIAMSATVGMVVQMKITKK